VQPRSCSPTNRRALVYEAFNDAICSGLRLSAAGLAIIGDLGSCSARLSSAAGSRSVIPGSQ
jgi:hypothetical protein